jgi:hypothetical protein
MDGEQYACMAVNTTSRLIENVTLQLRSISGGSLGTVECPAVEPWEVCTGGVPTALSDLVVTCEATSDRGAKGLRMTLMNVTTGGTSDAR